MTLLCLLSNPYHLFTVKNLKAITHRRYQRIPSLWQGEDDYCSTYDGTLYIDLS